MEQKDEKILCVIKQVPHDWECTRYKNTIAFKCCNISALKVLQYHMQYWTCNQYCNIYCNNCNINNPDYDQSWLSVL